MQGPMMHLVGYILEYYYDARTNESKTKTLNERTYAAVLEYGGTQFMTNNYLCTRRIVKVSQILYHTVAFAL
jgi:hypothetical protein